MLLLIATLVLFGLLVFLAIKIKDGGARTILPLMVVFVCVSGVIPSILATSKPRVEKIEQKYGLILKEINEYDTDTDFILKYELFERCKDFDLQILQHRRYYESIWIGRGYSKEIADLPLLTDIFIEKFNI